MTSVGSGEHVFNYPPIVVNVKGTIGINTAEPENYHARVNPIVRGSITSINIDDTEELDMEMIPYLTLVFLLKLEFHLDHLQNIKQL